MEILELNAQKRERVGKGTSRELRRNGMIPAVIYGLKHETELLAISMREFEQTLRNKKAGQFMLNLTIQNGTASSKQVMIKEIQKHPLSRNFLHVDFYIVSLERKIRVRVPVVTKGKCLGIEMGGSLQIIRRELEVLCLPMEIPKHIEIDVTNLDVGDVVHVKDLQLEGNIEIPADVNFTVLTVLSGKSGSDDKEAAGVAAEGETAEA